MDFSTHARDAFRARANDLGEAVLAAGAPRAAATVVRDSLSDQVLREVLNGHPEGAESILGQIADEVERFRPNGRSAATDRGALVRILLLHQIDSAWWGAVEPFRDAESVLGSSELVDLRDLRSRGRVAFRFRVQTSSFPVRGFRAVQRRVAPRASPVTAGLSFAYARPELVVLADSIAREYARRCGSDSAAGRAGVWINSSVRSLDHQRHLRSLGYSALEPSSHCSGHALDVAVQWLEHTGGADILKSVLTERCASGQINLIDEGQAWHVCASPDSMPGLRSGYDSLVSGTGR